MINLFMIKTLQMQDLILLLTCLMKLEFCYHEQNVTAKVYLVQSILSLYKLSTLFHRAGQKLLESQEIHTSSVRLKNICQV